MRIRGVGFATCHRLLLQLSQKRPQDAEPQTRLLEKIELANKPWTEKDLEPLQCGGLTLVLACRNLQKANNARLDLLRLLDEDIAKRSASDLADGHAKTFRQNLQIDCVYLDLAALKSVFQCGHEVNVKCVHCSAALSYLSLTD